jgi:hypothetical protein
MYNPSYLGGGDQEDLGSSPSWTKKVIKIPSQPTKSWLWWRAPVIPVGGVGSGIAVKTGLGKSVRPYLKNK